MITSASHSNITVTYDDANNTLAFSAAAQYGDSDVQSYLSGGSGLTLSGSGSFSVNTSNGVKIDGDDVELDYEIVSSAPSGVGSTSTGHLWLVVWYGWWNLHQYRDDNTTTLSGSSSKERTGT